MTNDFSYFTWSPDPKLFGQIDPEKQFQAMFPVMDVAISCWRKFAITVELNQNGNVHFHGYFSLKNTKSYLTRWSCIGRPKLKYNGNLRIDKVKHTLDTRYMEKDIFYMQEVIGVQLPITTAKPKVYERRKYQRCTPYSMSCVNLKYDPLTCQYVREFVHLDDLDSIDSEEDEAVDQ